MKRTLTRDEVREFDARAIDQYGIPGMVLMENAGRGVVDKLCQFGIDGPVLVCCGKGNNGGDGLVIARHLDLRRVTVEVALFAAPQELIGDALNNYRILSRTDVPIRIYDDRSEPAPTWRHELIATARRAGWIVDALLGTGTQGAPRYPLDRAIKYLNRVERPIVAVDLPSGLDADTGLPAAATIRALHTCTFVAPKPGFLAETAAPYLGRVHVLDIGAPRCLVDEFFRRPDKAC